VNTGFVLSCESDLREFAYPFIPFARIDETGSIKIDIVAPETLTCQWFNIPHSDDDEPELSVDDGSSEEAGPLDTGMSVTVFDCPQVPNPASCDVMTDAVSISIVARDGSGNDQVSRTDLRGSASFELESGTYRIETDPAFCFVQSSSSDENDDLVVSVGEVTEVHIFICD
jgi:hypothetical protein